MSFLALLVSSDSEASTALAPVLSSFGVGMRSCSYGDAVRELTEQKFDAVVVDFEDPQQAAAVLQNSCLASSHSNAVTVALLSDQTKVRSAFGAGAHFVLYKPISREQAQASLRAATILIRRERRRSARIPVQVPVQVQVTGMELEGILLDLSEEGMELLASQPLCPSARLTLRCNVPDMPAPLQVQGEVAWASPNGQAGVRFVDLSDQLRRELSSWVAANAGKMPSEEPDPVTACKLTDLSEGGCYLETESPFPEQTIVLVQLSAADLETPLQGMVRVMHPGSGMGIEFVSKTPSQRERLHRFIRQLLENPGMRPHALVTPHALAMGGDWHADEGSPKIELEDSLLSLLRGHEPLSQLDFLERLRQQRHTTEIASR